MMEDIPYNEFDMEMDMEPTFEDQEDVAVPASSSTDTTATPATPATVITTGTSEAPAKVRKKPGRKPNPASPALRKAQNRAAQRAFRERKERHLRELETAVRQIREQRDKLQLENDQLKSDSDILRSENWYLKGIVLTLQLVCFRHNLVIPKHSPYMNEEALSVLAQSMPEPIAAYMDANANNKLPIPLHLFGDQHNDSRRQRDRYLSSESIGLSKDNAPSSLQSTAPMPIPQPVMVPPQPSLSKPIDIMQPFNTEYLPEDMLHPLQVPSDPSASIDLPALSPVMDAKPVFVPPTCTQQMPQVQPMPRQQPEEAQEHLTSNLSAIQTLRLRLRLQSACSKSDGSTYAIQPTILQLTIPHDPRIDLIPAPHMRDRMILFRDLFDLDDCLRCLVGNSTFHGGDPTVAANWELPPEFFEKFWFLTIDYQLRRTTNKWRTMQGLDRLEEKTQRMDSVDEASPVESSQDMSPSSSLDDGHNIVFNDMTGFLPSDFFTQNPGCISLSDSVSSAGSSHSFANDATDSLTSNVDFFGPIQLTDGLSFSSHQKMEPIADTCHPWDVLLNNVVDTNSHDDRNALIEPEHV